MKVLHDAGFFCGHALSFWKIKPEPTAAIPKGITTGYKEMITQMHSQT